MAIIYDTSASGTSVIGGNSLTYSHTCTGGKLILFVAATVRGGDHLTGITYNGVSLTKVDSSLNAQTDGNYTYLYYLLNPATGAHNVVVSTNNAGDSIAASSTSYKEVKQTAQPDAHSNGSSSENNLAQSVTSVADNCWTVMGCAIIGSYSVGGGTTQRAGAIGFGGGTNAIFDSNGAIHPAGSTSLNITTGASTEAAMASFAPFESGIRYWVGGTGNWYASTTTHWSATSGGVGGYSVPTSSFPVVFDANSGVGTVTISATANCQNLTCTGYTGTLTGSSALNVYGSMTLVNTMTYSVTGTLTFAATSTGMTITTAGQTLVIVVFNGVGGGWIFQDTPTITTSITLMNGALNLNATTAILQGTGTVWSASPTFSLTCGTSTIKLTDASSSSKTFAGGGLTYNNLWLTGSGTGAFIITGSNTFQDFKCDTPPHTIQFTAGTTQTLATFTVNGTAGNLMTLQSTSAGSSWYLKQSGVSIINCDYLSLQDSHVS